MVRFKFRDNGLGTQRGVECSLTRIPGSDVVYEVDRAIFYCPILRMDVLYYFFFLMYERLFR